MTVSEARPDVARIRLDNALALFDEFVRATVRDPDAATLRGLEGRFAERLQIQPSYWSQIKSRARQIGERLARQFETQCRKPHGWLDEVHTASAGHRAGAEAGRGPASLNGADASLPHAGRGASTPAPGGAFPGHEATGLRAVDDDERFIVGLVLSYYRRHPERARARLLELLGEALDAPAPPDASRRRATPRAAVQPRTSARRAAPADVGEPAVDDGALLWERTRTGVAPLKRKR